MQIMTLLEMIWKTLLIKNYIKHYIKEMKNGTLLKENILFEYYFYNNDAIFYRYFMITLQL